jgi:hypothetical protein
MKRITSLVLIFVFIFLVTILSSHVSAGYCSIQVGNNRVCGANVRENVYQGKTAPLVASHKYLLFFTCNYTYVIEFYATSCEDGHALGSSNRTVDSGHSCVNLF